MNLGYAHSWAFSTRTQTRLIEPTPQWPGLRETKSRDLQVGRFLFGVTYRLNERTSVNWSVEVGDRGRDRLAHGIEAAFLPVQRSLIER